MKFKQNGWGSFLISFVYCPTKCWQSVCIDHKLTWSHQHSLKLGSWCSNVYSITSNIRLITIQNHQSLIINVWKENYGYLLYTNSSVTSCVSYIQIKYPTMHTYTFHCIVYDYTTLLSMLLNFLVTQWNLPVQNA